MPGKAEVQPPPAEHQAAGSKHADVPCNLCRAIAAGHTPRAAESARTATTTCSCPDALDHLLAASCAGLSSHSQLHLVRCSACKRLLLAAAFHAHLPLCRCACCVGTIPGPPCRRHASIQGFLCAALYPALLLDRRCWVKACCEALSAYCSVACPVLYRSCLAESCDLSCGGHHDLPSSSALVRGTVNLGLPNVHF